MSNSITGEPSFPRRTAGYFPSDQEQTYWVQTLNEPQMERAQEEARWIAREYCRPYRKGGKRHASLLAQARALTAEEQALHLAGHEVFTGRVRQAVWEKFPDPERPERKPEQSDEEWMSACDKWEAEKKKAAGKREKEAEKIVEAKRKEALGIDAKERIAACVEATVEREFAGEFLRALEVEILLRAVRDPEDRRRMAFEDAQEIEDLPDGGKSLWEFYCALDAVTPSEVPTSPASS